MKKENIDACFEEIRHLLAKACDRDPSEMEGVYKLREKWEEGKKWLFPFFDEWGRREIVPDVLAEDISAEDIRAARSVAFRKMEAIKAKDRFASVEVCCIPCAKNFLVSFTENFTAQELAENKTAREYGGFPKGTKISKILREESLDAFSHHGDVSKGTENEKLLREFLDIVFSLFVSSIKPKGDKVVLSVNPIDILFASVHTTGNPPWRSCHHFVDGEWRTGTLSYMCDGVTAIAYAYDRVEPFKLYGYTTTLLLPVKKWRQMVYFDKVNLSAIHSREYVENKPVYSKYARKLSGYLLAELGGVERKWIVSFPSPGSKGLDEDVEPVESKSYRLQKKASWIYQDPPDTMSAIIRLKDGGNPPSIRNGATHIPCPVCGTLREDDENHDSLLCEDCGCEYHCDACGCGLDEDDVYYYGGDSYCRDCFYEMYDYCRHCEEAYRLEDLTRTAHDDLVCDDCLEERYFYCNGCGEYYIESYNDEYYCRDTGNTYCENCAYNNDVEQCYECGDCFENDYTEIYGNYYCSDCREKLFVQCQKCGEWIRDAESRRIGARSILCPDCVEEVAV